MVISQMVHPPFRVRIIAGLDFRFAALLVAGLAVWFTSPGMLAADEELKLLVFAAYGTPQAIYVQGRVLESRGRAAPGPNDGKLKNLRRALSDWRVDEVKKARLSFAMPHAVARGSSDREGLFAVTLIPDPGFQFMDGQLLSIEARAKLEGRARKVSHSLKPSILQKGDVAIVSDVDDTIVDSDVTHKLRLLWGTFLKNAAQLRPIPGMALLYQELGTRRARQRRHFFYLSGSPMNLYERLTAYLNLHGFPAGSFFLKNLGLRNSDSLREQKQYKLARLEKLVRRLPGVRFLCFGDNGQSDIEVYGEFRKRHPQSVAGIFIRQVPPARAGGPVPNGVCLGETASDLAGALANKGFLTTARVKAVADALQSAKDTRKPAPQD